MADEKKRRKPPTEGRLRRHWRHAQQVYHEPRSLGGLVRQGLLGIWRARGGGFYGLGYLVTFVFLEMRLVVTEFASSQGVLAFIAEELVGYLLRLGFMSFVNVALAFIWPALVLERIGGWGLLVIGLGYVGFERWARPAVEARFPELRQRDGKA